MRSSMAEQSKRRKTTECETAIDGGIYAAARETNAIADTPCTVHGWDRGTCAYATIMRRPIFDLPAPVAFATAHLARSRCNAA